MNAPVNPAMINAQKRAFLLSKAVDMMQATATGTITGGAAAAGARGPSGVINVALRNVGMLKRIILKLECTITQVAAETLALTKWGPANFLSNLQMTDLNNQQRIMTTGWHLHAVASARRQFAYGAAFLNDSPVQIGSNMNVIRATQSVQNTARTITMYYEIPAAYSDDDLRGAMYVNVVNATFNLQFTVNPNFVVTSTADPTLAVYQSNGTDLGTLGTITYTVYQNYLDQIPQDANGPIVPDLDIATAYLLNNTAVTSGLGVGQDFPISYSNYRSFMSTFVIFNNGGTLNKGTDVNYWALQSANFTNLFKLDPTTVALRTRNIISDDFPDGTYYFDHRRRPIITVQFGNMQLVVNPSTVNAGAQLLIGYETLAYQNQIAQAGSLYAGA